MLSCMAIADVLSCTIDAMCLLVFFFFQAEDGIRDKLVTGVQTCALPICLAFPAPCTQGRLSFEISLFARRSTTCFLGSLSGFLLFLFHWRLSFALPLRTM